MNGVNGGDVDDRLMGGDYGDDDDSEMRNRMLYNVQIHLESIVLVRNSRQHS